MPMYKKVLFTVILAAIVFVLVFIPLALKYPEKTPLSRTPKDVGLSFESIVLTPADTDIELAGWWMPAEQPEAVLVFIHGGSSNRDSSFFKGLEFYRAIVSSNVSVLTIDLRNHGESDDDGLGVSFGLREKWDAQAAIHWARQRANNLPLYAMGISMGGATLIYALEDGAQVEGLIMLDPLLDSRSAMLSAIYASSGVPTWLVWPSALAAEFWFGFPSQDRQPLAVASDLDLPILLLQDPGDPVTHARYARKLASENRRVQLWEAAALDEEALRLAGTGRWGSHVAAFHLFPEQTLAQIRGFIGQN
jgi:hypothetical protein